MSLDWSRSLSRSRHRAAHITRAEAEFVMPEPKSGMMLALMGSRTLCAALAVWGAAALCLPRSIRGSGVGLTCGAKIDSTQETSHAIPADVLC